MLRRAILSNKAGLTAAVPVLTLPIRLAYHRPTKHDWSEIWTGNLTAEETVNVHDQNFRTVSAVVPGEMFMRHWIAAEQSTVSVVNRVLSGIIAVFMMIWAAGYATLGYNGHNAAHVAGWTFIAYWLVLHTHMMWLAPTFTALALCELVLN